MKRLLFALVVLAITFSVVHSQEPTANTSPKRAQDLPSSLAGWIKYSSPEGRYSIKFPAEPKLTSQEASNSDGLKASQYMASAHTSDAFCTVGYFDFASNIVFSLDKARDGVLNRVKGTLLSESLISLGGHAGRELKVTANASNGAEFLVRVRMYLVDQRVYFLQFIVLATNDTPTFAKQSAEYFDSFSVSTP
jgi:hypothetical protein